MKKLIYFFILVTATFSFKTSFASDCHADYEFIVTGSSVAFTDISTADPGPIISYLWNFGDGSTSTDANPTHVYATPGVYDVCLTIHADGGCVDEKCDNVTIDAGDCSASFEYTVDGSNVSFNSTTTPGGGDVITYLWNFGDGTYGDADNPDHTYAAGGTYLVCLTVYFDGGCIAEYCHEVTIAATGDCTATFVVTSIDGNNVHFFGSVTPAADVVTYTWSFGDGTTYTETGTGAGVDPWHMYPASGVYTVCLSIETGDGCTDEFCSEVVIGGGDCHSHFEFTNDGMTIHFYETATGDVTSYLWDFGDGTTSDAANPSHTYAEAGSYEVCLTIETAAGCVDTYCHMTEAVAGGGDCASDFEYTTGGLTVNYFETADGGGSEIISYAWDFGDGTESTDANPTHTYSDAENYTVCLTITTAAGCVSTFCNEVTVEAGAAGDCEAYFVVSGMELTPDGWVVTLDNGSTAAADIISTLWYFGDGTIGDSFDASHTYLSAGSYLICMVISTADGCTSEYCQNIFVGETGGDCSSDFEWSDTGLTVDFTETADGAGADIVSYIWTFDDGTTADGATVTHTFDHGGEYEVCLTIITADSCIDTHCEIIHVEGEPAPCTASFDITSIEETADGWVVHFDNNTTGTDHFMWTFGDGGTSDTTNPAHLFTTPGIYTVCLTVGVEGTDCYDTYCEEIFVGSDDDCVDETVIDPEMDCGEVVDPVCGCNGVTYDNSCIAYYQHGVMFWTSGACAFTTIDEENIFASVQVSPNPASDNVLIHYMLRAGSDVQIDLTDITGRNVVAIYHQSSVAGNYNFQLNTSDLASGIYMIRLHAGGEQNIQKLVISK